MLASEILCTEQAQSMFLQVILYSEQSQSIFAPENLCLEHPQSMFAPEILILEGPFFVRPRNSPYKTVYFRPRNVVSGTARVNICPRKFVSGAGPVYIHA